jgi:hypothetical protein
MILTSPVLQRIGKLQNDMVSSLINLRDIIIQGLFEKFRD